MKLIVLTVAAVFIAAPSAFAYRENVTSTDPNDTLPYACPSCHGLEAGVASPTVDASGPAKSRKGPHGGYTSGTNKCDTCHSVHSAPAGSRLLLPEATIVATCNTCHDGTGGGGVYGVIFRRTGAQPAGHRIDVSSGGEVSIPGGDPNGGSLSRAFSGENGGLTCVDCHSPHDSKTVSPFVGDRVRSVNDTTPAVATNRLLWQRPTSATNPTTKYGSEWCQGCHKGSSRGTMTHPVGSLSSTIPVDYMNVRRLSDYDTTSTATELGPLGGTNLGYVVPPGTGALPICQQCHEDTRSISNDGDPKLSVDGTSERFSASVDGAVPGNPTFQNFPHETVNPKMLVETRDSLCLNCHNVDTGDNPH